VIRVAYSGINYKDALAISGKAPIVRGAIRTAGIDLIGVVETSSDSRFTPGDRVLVTGSNIGESLDADFPSLRVSRRQAIVPLPPGLACSSMVSHRRIHRAMSVWRMQETTKHRSRPDRRDGPTGGGGALPWRYSSGPDLDCCADRQAWRGGISEALGADEIVNRLTLDFGSKPLEKAVWAGPWTISGAARSPISAARCGRGGILPASALRSRRSSIPR